MTDREQMVEDKRQEALTAYTLSTLEQAELQAACCATFCRTWLEAMAGSGLAADDLLRLLHATLPAAPWR